MIKHARCAQTLPLASMRVSRPVGADVRIWDTANLTLFWECVRIARTRKHALPQHCRGGELGFESFQPSRLQLGAAAI